MLGRHKFVPPVHVERLTCGKAAPRPRLPLPGRPRRPLPPHTIPIRRSRTGLRKGAFVAGALRDEAAVGALVWAENEAFGAKNRFR